MHLFKSNRSKMERDKLGVSLPLTEADDIAMMTHMAGDRVKEVKILSIFRKMARERRGCISSVMRLSLR